LYVYSGKFGKTEEKGNFGGVVLVLLWVILVSGLGYYGLVRDFGAKSRVLWNTQNAKASENRFCVECPRKVYRNRTLSG
jgi:hypothetical protein